MAQATKVVSFVALVCIVYTSILSPTGARTMPSGVHSQEPLDDGATSRSHFEDFVRALTAARTNAGLIVLPADEDMPNDVFPLDTEHRHRAASEELERAKESQQRAFKSNPTPANGALQKRSGGRYCGSVLADVLELVCGKSFLSLFGNNKRSAPPGKTITKTVCARQCFNE